jgi:hypothetical protein
MLRSSRHRRRSVGRWSVGRVMLRLTSPMRHLEDSARGDCGPGLSVGDNAREGGTLTSLRDKSRWDGLIGMITMESAHEDVWAVEIAGRVDDRHAGGFANMA